MEHLACIEGSSFWPFVYFWGAAFICVWREAKSIGYNWVEAIKRNIGLSSRAYTLKGFLRSMLVVVPTLGLWLYLVWKCDPNIF